MPKAHVCVLFLEQSVRNRWWQDHSPKSGGGGLEWLGFAAKHKGLVGGLCGEKLERVMGIEPTLFAWEAKVLPLNYTRLKNHYR
jgi:hypothetical protein